jgi:FixJ family two-component response regulator
MGGVEDGQLGPWQVAVVDDDQAVRQGLCNLLLSVGYSVTGYDSAESFLADGRLERYGCAVLDIKLQGMGGLDCQEQLLYRGVRLPLIFITGFGERAMETRALRAGAIAFLHKPIDVDALLHHLQQAMGGAP